MKSFFRRKLKNGITVLFEKRDLPVVSFSISMPFGGGFENSDVKGIAHFIEHLVFTGTKTRTHEDISREIEKKGGILNAYTAQEVTSFWFKLPSEHLFSGIDILSDMLNNPVFKPDKFEKEKKVILEEIKMYHDDPSRQVYEQIEKNLYGPPFGEGIIGREETINNLKRDYVVEFFNKVYGSSDFIVTLVGNADFEKVCDYIEKKFDKKHGQSKMPTITKKNDESTEERPGIDQAHLVFAIHAPPSKSKEFYALEVLDAYLANGMSSRLFLKIREEKGLAYSVRGMINSEKSYSYYSIYAGTTKAAIKQVKEIILEEFDNVKKMSEQDLKEAKDRILGLRRLAAEESSTVMNEIMMNELLGKAEEYYKHDEEIRKVKLDDVKKLAKISKYSTAAIIPK
jgi:predicted Zn-dependent peptidase